jgi:PST family polysaccharide transporter
MSSWTKSIFSKNFINLSLNQGVNIIATLIYTPFLFQNLGDENFGLINLAFSIVIMLTILVSYGYNLNGPIKIAQSKNLDEENSVIIEILNIRLSLSLIIFIFLIPFVIFYPDQFFQKILLFSLIILFTEALNPLFYLQGKNKIFPQSILNFFSKTLYVILIVLFVSKYEDSYLANFFYGFSITLLFLFFWVQYFTRNDITYLELSIKKTILNLKQNFQFFLSSTSTHFTLNSALIVLSFFATSKELGRFTLAYKVAFLLRMLPVFFIQSALQQASKFNLKSNEAYKNYISKYFKFGLLITILIAVITFIFSDMIIYVFSAEKIDYSSKILSILGFIPFFAMLNFKNVIYLLVNDLKYILNKATFFTMIFMLLSSLILSYLYSGLGLAYALVLTELVSFSIHYYLINKK